MVHPDDEGFTYSTDAEWDRQGAYEMGAARPDLAWIASDRDAWYPNPFYVGPPVPHPESYDGEDEGDGVDGDFAGYAAWREATYDDIPF
jgi:hypothetical protein